LKLCCWSGKRCYASNCTVFECSTGNVSVCRFHGHKDGMFQSRKVIVDGHFSIFDVWYRKLHGEVIVFG
jgi:hypothetical protein